MCSLRVRTLRNDWSHAMVCSTFYLVTMRYRAEAFRRDTDDLAADLGHWESKRGAQAACVGHARELLTWDQPWSGIW